MKIYSKYNCTVLLLAILIFIFFLSLSILQPKAYSLEKLNTKNNIIENLNDFKKLETSNSIIYYKETDEIFANPTSRIIDLYLPLLVKDYELNNINKVNIIIYEDILQLKEVLGFDSEIEDSKLPIGLYYSGIINILSPNSWSHFSSESEAIEGYINSGTIVHELSHLLTDLKTQGNYETWLSEGLALYYEDKYCALQWRLDLKEDSKTITFEQLQNNFESIDTALAYRRSYDIINDYITLNGEKKLQDELLLIPLRQ